MKSFNILHHLSMKLKIKYFIFLFSIAFISGGMAQIPQNPIGSNPFSLKWKQINTDKVQIIFPQGLDSSAQRIANIVHVLWDIDEKSIGRKNIKVPILLNGLRVNPNAFVLVGPFRSEFFNIPPQFKNLTSWTDHLAIHEYRHVQQLANSDQGITGLSKNIFGSWIWGGFAATALPRWYLEGDAVVAETELTSAGRGRFPYFNMEYHALIQENVEYNYEKATAGSYKDFVPNFYKLGYNLMAYGRENYGEDLWQKVADDAVRYKGLFYPFAKSLKRNTGLTPKDLYHATMNNLQEKWSAENFQKNENDIILNGLDKSTVIHYNSPTPIENGNVIALKSGYNQLNELILIKQDGVEEKLTKIGLLPDQQMTSLSYTNGNVIWAEQGYHPRWRNETYSEVVNYNIFSRKKKRLTKKTRYFSPSYSPDGKYITAVKVNKDLSQSIIILDGHSGNEIDIIYHTANEELSFPKWLNESTVVFLKTINQENQILSIDTQTKKTRPLSQISKQHLSHLFTNKGIIYASMASDYTNDIYQLSREDGTFKKLSASSIGAFQPAVKDDRLYYSEFSNQGYNIVLTTLNNDSNLRNSDSNNQSNLPFYPTLIQQENGNFLDDVPFKKCPVTGFNRFSGIFNFHSIIPEWQPPEVSLSLLSDNVFNTLSAEIEGRYNYNEDAFQYGIGLQYAELYPIINVSYFKADRESIFYNFLPSTDSSFVQDVVIDRWNENRATIGASIPYNFSRGSMSNRLNLFMSYQNSAISLRDTEEDRVLIKDTIVVGQGNLNRFESIFTDPISDQTIHTMDIGVSLRMFKFRAIQHLRPRLGLSLDVRYRSNVGDNLLGGNSFLARGFLYLPGISKNHSFSIDAMMVNEDILSNYRYSDIFVYPRGYGFSLRRDKFLKVAFNYRFPIAYPDWPIGGFAFIKRLKGNAFFDFGRFGITSFPFTEQYSHVNSLGFELGIDVRVLRLLEIDLGVRYSYLLNEDFVGNSRHQFDFFVISITE